MTTRRPNEPSPRPAGPNPKSLLAGRNDLAERNDVVQRLERAQADRAPCPPVRDVLGGTDVEAAYAVQRELIGRRTAQGARVVGRKIGLTSPAVQQQLGVDRPDFGVLLDDMAFEDGAMLPTGRLLQPKVEAEVAFVLAEDLPDGPFDDARVATAVAYAVAALEIVDSRIAGWDITIVDTVADNASSGLFVLGAHRLILRDFSPVDVTMSMTVNGGLVSEGTGAACLGDPLHALAWLAATAARFGDPLRAGQVVLSGALGPMAPVTGGDEVVATIGALGTVAVTFAPLEEDR